jgi:hypothetical protein
MASAGNKWPDMSALTGGGETYPDRHKPKPENNNNLMLLDK